MLYVTPATGEPKYRNKALQVLRLFIFEIVHKILLQNNAFLVANACNA